MTPTAVNSAVSTGWFHEVGHEALRGEVVDLVRPRIVEAATRDDLVEQVGLDELMRSSRCAMRSTFSVEERRAMPKTS